jgi:hypothetical protein
MPGPHPNETEEQRRAREARYVKEERARAKETRQAVIAVTLIALYLLTWLSKPTSWMVVYFAALMLIAAFAPNEDEPEQHSDRKTQDKLQQLQAASAMSFRWAKVLLVALIALARFPRVSYWEDALKHGQLYRPFPRTESPLGQVKSPWSRSASLVIHERQDRLLELLADGRRRRIVDHQVE